MKGGSDILIKIITESIVVHKYLHTIFLFQMFIFNLTLPARNSLQILKKIPVTK